MTLLTTREALAKALGDCWHGDWANRLNERGSVDGPAVFLIGAAIFALYLVAVLVVAR